MWPYVYVHVCITVGHTHGLTCLCMYYSNTYVWPCVYVFVVFSSTYIWLTTGCIVGLQCNSLPINVILQDSFYNTGPLIMCGLENNSRKLITQHNECNYRVTNSYKGVMTAD